jgi:putative polyketide hydroxylase
VTADVQVLVVGAGPAGLAAAIELADRGVDTLVIERRAPDGSDHPRATAISRRTMATLRRWGLEDAVHRAGFAADYAMSIRPSLVEREVKRIPLPDHVWACAQDHLAPIITNRAIAAGATVRFHAELEGLAMHADGVTATVNALPAGGSEIVRAQFVIGADGAHGVVRRLAGVGMARRGDFGDWLSILFHAPVRDYVDSPPCVVYGIGDPSSFEIAHRHDHRGIVTPTDAADRWIRGLKWHPEAGEQLSDYTEARCTSIVRDAVGVANLPVTVAHVQPFRMTAGMADTFRTGRVVLAGDAAHVFPPSTGMGMNLAIEDGIALGVSLADVLAGNDPGPLETYETARRDAAMQFLAQDLSEPPLADVPV